MGYELTQRMGDSSDRGLSVTEVARRLSLHPNTVRKMVRRGLFRATKVGKVWRIRESEVERALSEGLGAAHREPLHDKEGEQDND
jgi:excisionase family DNA binding protein